LNSFAGWKGAIINIVVAFLIIFHFSFRDLTKTIIVGFLILIVLFFIFIYAFEVVDNYRQAARESGPSVSILKESFKTGINSEAVETKLIKVSQRISYGSMFAQIVNAVENHLVEFQYGATLLPIFTWFVPRAFWPNKPQVSIGGWFAEVILGWSPGGGEAAITLPGDLYYNFGIPGVILGMLLLGLFLRFAYEYLVIHIGTASAVWLFLPIYLELGLGLERNAAFIITPCLQTLISLLIILAVGHVIISWGL